MQEWMPPEFATKFNEPLRARGFAPKSIKRRPLTEHSLGTREDSHAVARGAELESGKGPAESPEDGCVNSAAAHQND